MGIRLFKRQSRTSESKQRLGPRGEALARSFLRKKKKLKILARNYRCPVGEVDLIALQRASRKRQNNDTLVFVEVKTRSSDRFTTPDQAVNADKRRRIRNVANYYVTQRDAQDYAIRYDIVAIVIPPDEKPRITHHEAAF